MLEVRSSCHSSVTIQILYRNFKWIHSFVALCLFVDHKYEAYIHDIRGNTIYAKFNEQFRLRYDGTYVTVEFRLGRTTYKRCHHAVQQAVQYLGEDWLFPELDTPLFPARIPFLETSSSHTDSDISSSLQSELQLEPAAAQSPPAQAAAQPTPSEVSITRSFSSLYK